MFKSRKLLALLLLLTAGCGKDSKDESVTPVIGGTKKGVCNYPAGPSSPGPMCGQISNATDDELASFDQFVCNGGDIKGTYTEGGTCATVDVIHSCEINVAPLAFKFNLSFFASHTVQSSTALCQELQAQASGG